MKTQKIPLLDFDDDDEKITLGLVRLAKEIADYELFFRINLLNSFNFTRISDLAITGDHFDHSFTRYEAFHPDSKVCIHFIANKSSSYVQKKISTELFAEEQETKYLLDHFQDVDYLIKTSEPFGDFSLILLPEQLLFQVQNFELEVHEELYHIIQYYE